MEIRIDNKKRGTSKHIGKNTFGNTQRNTITDKKKKERDRKKNTYRNELHKIHK